MTFSRASACPRRITSKVSKRVVQVLWTPTHANRPGTLNRSLAVLVPVYSLGTSFISLYFCKLISCSLALRFFPRCGNGACCLCSWVRSWALNDIALLDSKPPWIHEMLRSGDAQAAAPAPMWWRWRCTSSHLGKNNTPWPLTWF